MSECKHAPSGCNYPEAHCAELCSSVKRYPRTTGEAFRDADYAGAVYRYPRPRRTRWGLWLALAVVVLLVVYL